VRLERLLSLWDGLFEIGYCFLANLYLFLLNSDGTKYMAQILLSSLDELSDPDSFNGRGGAIYSLSIRDSQLNAPEDMFTRGY
jgi:hypothetical protein